MRLTTQTLCSVLLAMVAATSGCRAQVPAKGTLTPDLARRVELLIRTRTKIPPDYLISVGPRTASDVAGYDHIDVIVTADGKPMKPISFLLSTDGKTLAQFNKYDISQDPKTLVSGAGRPARGGAENAPVEIVLFDDLECPFCAKMHTALFPALLDRYGAQVRIVYRDYPLAQIHPWAMRAAVDTNCVATQNPQAYWNLVDYIHAHAGELMGTDKSVQKANDALDKLTVDEAKKDGLKAEAVEECVKKQDDKDVKASLKMGDDLGVDSTPVLFINGEKLAGAYPISDVFRMVDGALVAAGKIPPAPYKAPSELGPAPSPIPATVAAPKPGS